MHLILCKACYRTSIVSAFSGDEQKQFEYATCGAYFFEKGEKNSVFKNIRMQVYRALQENMWACLPNMRL